MKIFTLFIACIFSVQGFSADSVSKFIKILKSDSSAIEIPQDLVLTGTSMLNPEVSMSLQFDVENNKLTKTTQNTTSIYSLNPRKQGNRIQLFSFQRALMNATGNMDYAAAHDTYEIAYDNQTNTATLTCSSGMYIYPYYWNPIAALRHYGLNGRLGWFSMIGVPLGLFGPSTTRMYQSEYKDKFAEKDVGYESTVVWNLDLPSIEEKNAE